MPAQIGMSASTAGLVLAYWGDKEQLGSVLYVACLRTLSVWFPEVLLPLTDRRGRAVVTRFVYVLGRAVGTKRGNDPDFVSHTTHVVVRWRPWRRIER